MALSPLEGLDLDHSHPFHAARARLLERLGRFGEASQAYTAALALTSNAAERRFLTARRTAMARPRTRVATAGTGTSP